MPSDFPSAEQERQMLRDVAAMESLDGGTEWELSMCCHVKALLSAVAELRAENSSYRRWFGCPACSEDHATQSMCPPHETRTTGLAWFHSAVRTMRNEMNELRSENARLRAERDEADQTIAAMERYGTDGE